MALDNLFSLQAKYVFFMMLIIATYHVADGQRLGQTNLVVFLHDVTYGPNSTVVPVTGAPGKPWRFNSFGTMFVIDDPITRTPNKNSSQIIGRAQGTMAASALDGSNVQVLLSLVFTNFEDNGSSLEIQGSSRQVESYREVSVVGGTGKYRFARGFAAFETIYFDRVTSYSIVRCTVTLLQAQ